MRADRVGGMDMSIWAWDYQGPRKDAEGEKSRQPLPFVADSSSSRGRNDSPDSPEAGSSGSQCLEPGEHEDPRPARQLRWRMDSRAELLPA
jgi:hypothetical protein